jgi:hypothetical protein
LEPITSYRNRTFTPCFAFSISMSRKFVPVLSGRQM